MRVDVSDLQQFWVENEIGSRFVPNMGIEGEHVAKPIGFIHIHEQLVTRLTEEISTEITAEAVAECSHPDDARRSHSSGEHCLICGGSRTRVTGDEWLPWQSGGTRFTCANARKWQPALVLAMTRPTEAERARQRERWDREQPSIIIGTRAGDHQAPLTAPYLLGLEEAIIVSARACERCENALFWMYGVMSHDASHGYPEMSEHWKRSGTSCRFCAHMGFVRERRVDDPSRVTPKLSEDSDDENPF